MKKLILPIIFSSLTAHAVDEIFTKDDQKQVVSTIKDLEVQEMLEKTKEFQECRKLNEFEKGKTPTDEMISKAQDCFRKKLGSEQNPEKLKKLSEILNLQQFGLVKSNNAKDIQNYLNNKMYKSLTGVDPDEADKKKLIESMKFKNKKHIDQALFIRLYKTQLSKNALFEISRYCFENLRRDNKTDAGNFGDHWKNYDPVQDPESKEPKQIFLNVNDLGEPAFTAKVADPEKKDEIYKSMLDGINVQGGINLQSFYLACANTMVKLCDQFKAGTKVDETKSQVNTTPKSGATSCLAKNRIQELKKGITDSTKIEESFKELMEKGTLAESLIQNEPIKIFTPGKDGADSLDNLTNFTSTDMLEGGVKGKSDEFDDCEKNPAQAKCEKLLSDSDNFERAKHDVEMEMTLRREVEMERVRQLKRKNDQGLTDYLKENGYFDILAKVEKNEFKTEDELANAIGQEFEAKKIATLQEMNRKLGSRQSKPDKKDENEANIKKVVQESKSERARLAQVVMFNNIITSHLELTRQNKEGKSESAGRNVNAWKKEEESLKKAKVDESLFKNIKVSDDGKSKGIGEEEQIGGLSFIDKILGKESEAKPK